MNAPATWKEAANGVRLQLELEVASCVEYDKFMTDLSGYLNHLIETNFSRLLFFLYRIDVSEAKLRYLLSENQDADAGRIIAELMMERELKKISSRETYKAGECEEEKW